MAHKPKTKSVFPPGREGVWAAIRELRIFTNKDLRALSQVGEDSVRDYIKVLARAGYVQAVAGNRGTYRLVRDCGVHAPQIDAQGRDKPVSGRQRMWMAMKALKTFTYRDLSFAAQVSDADAKFYLIRLCRAGYLAVVSRKTALPDVVKFVSARDTGPNPPQVRKDKSVYDRNLHKVVWTPGHDRRAA